MVERMADLMQEKLDKRFKKYRPSEAGGDHWLSVDKDLLKHHQGEEHDEFLDEYEAAESLISAGEEVPREVLARLETEGADLSNMTAMVTERVYVESGLRPVRDVVPRGFELLFKEATEWSDETFGLGRDPLEVLDKLGEELEEARDDTGDIFEYADLLLTVLDSAHKAGFTAEELLDASLYKLEVMKGRKWEKVDPERPHHHVEGTGGKLDREYWEESFRSGRPLSLVTRARVVPREEVPWAAVKHCPKCGAEMVVKEKRGMFYSCPNFPRCRMHTIALEDDCALDDEDREMDYELGFGALAPDGEFY
jgi:hypothetical protein